MKSIKDMNIAEFAAYISDFLEERGHRCILSGGACISIYTSNKYESFDLDFIPITFIDRKKVERDLGEIGFYADGRYFKHSDTRFFIEFPSPPPSIGEEPVKNINLQKVDDHTIRMLTPTDSVKDRLCGYFFWNDMQSLYQAAAVVRSQQVNLKEIKLWSSREGQIDKFKVFESMLKGKH
jgi:hypothetical protein